MNDTTIHLSSRPAGKALLLSVIVWGIGLVVTVTIGVDRTGWWMVPLFIGGAIAGFVMWRGCRWPDDWSPYLSFGGALLVALIANRFLYIADFLIAGEHFSEWPISSSWPEWDLFKAEVITIVGTLITFFVWLWAGGAKYSLRLLLTTDNASTIPILTIIYALSIFGLIWNKFSPESAMALGQLVGTSLALGIASSFFLPMALRRSSYNILGLTIILSLPFVYFSLLSGMKENIILALLPIGVSSWTSMRGSVARSALIFAVILLFAVITPFVSYFRGEAWFGGRVLTEQQALGEFGAKSKFTGTANTLTTGIQQFLRRGNTSAYRGWAITISDEQGFEPELVFAPMVYVFIPRVIWPDKPNVEQGLNYSGLLYGKQYATPGGSSSSAGLYPGFYLGYGWPAVAVGAALVGLLIAGLSRFAWRLGGPVMFGLFAFSLLPFALRLDESWIVDAISLSVIRFVYIYLIFKVSQFVGSFIKLNKMQTRSQ